MGGEVIWHHLPVERIFKLLKSGMEGITQDEADLRLAQFGPNEVEVRKKKGPLYQFAKQFASPLIYVLLAAAVLTFILREYIDMAVILGVVLANAAIGFIQERKAEHALESLSRMLVPEATVLRNGLSRVISSRELVRGDVVLLKAGDRVPTDLRLFYEKNLRADESVLTGESAVVEKNTQPLELEDIPLADRRNMVFAGTLITQGLGRGVVVATAGDTQIGRISELIRESRKMATPLIRKMSHFGMVMSVVITVVAVFTFAVGMLRGFAVLDMFLASVSLAVAAIPEGLPAVITISLAIGVKTMACRNAIIRTMPAVETLGSATVICSDKTGTLTKNQMTVTRVCADRTMYDVTGVGYEAEGNFMLGNVKIDPSSFPALMATLKAGTLCNDASFRDGGIEGDPTEGALLISALKAAEFHLPRLDVIPFEPEQRYMATLHRDSDGGTIMYVKGSPEKIVEMCRYQFKGTGFQSLDAGAILAAADEMASDGLRVMGMAYREMDMDTEDIEPADVRDLVFTGLQGMMDPPREEVVESIRKCKTAGIRVIMITGDHLHTALTIAGELGIETQGAISGVDIDSMEDEELEKALVSVSVFARTSPEHKLRLVELLKGMGEVVAATGDGINDAPALKTADIGIAMGISGTEVAKEASDMVLADDNFASIVSAVEEGRDVYSKIQKIILWTLPTNGGEGVIVMCAVLLGTLLPMLPMQILWINTVTVVGLGVPFTVEPKEPGLLERSPRPPGEPLLLPLIKERMVLMTILMVIAAFLMFYFELNSGRQIDTARTITMNTIVFIEAMYLFNSKSLHEHAFGRMLNNRSILLGIAIVAGLQMLITYHPLMNAAFRTAPLAPSDWIWIIAAAFAAFIVIETEKSLRRWRKGRIPVDTGGN